MYCQRVQETGVPIRVTADNAPYDDRVYKEFKTGTYYVFKDITTANKMLARLATSELCGDYPYYKKSEEQIIELSSSRALARQALEERIEA